MSDADIREELAELGRRRQQQKDEDKELAEEVKVALRRAASSTVSIAEAARLLGIHRTTVYRVYHPHDA